MRRTSVISGLLWCQIAVVTDLATVSPARTRKFSTLPVLYGVSVLVTSSAAPHCPCSRYNWTREAVLIWTNIPVRDVPCALLVNTDDSPVVRSSKGRQSWSSPDNLICSRPCVLLPDGCSGTNRSVADQHALAIEFSQIRQVSV